MMAKTESLGLRQTRRRYYQDQQLSLELIRQEDNEEKQAPTQDR